jgi:hypothetical protein
MFLRINSDYFLKQLYQAILLMEMHFDFFEVGTECLNIKMDFSFKGLMLAACLNFFNTCQIQN